MGPKKRQLGDQDEWAKSSWDRWYDRSDAKRWHPVRNEEGEDSSQAAKWQKMVGSDYAPVQQETEQDHDPTARSSAAAWLGPDTDAVDVVVSDVDSDDDPLDDMLSLIHI